MKPDINFYRVNNDEVWSYVKRLTAMLENDDKGKTQMQSGGQSYCFGILRTLEYVMSEGESPIDLDSIKMKVKK